MKRLLKRILVLLMWYPLRAVIEFLPLRTVYSLGAIGGGILHRISREKQAVMSAELSAVLPDSKAFEVERIVRESFVNYCVSELEILLYPSMNAEKIRKFVTIEGAQYLDAALSKRKGVLLFQAHFGAFQMVMPAIGYSGYRMNQISASAELWKGESGAEIDRKTFDIKARHERLLPVQHVDVRSSMRPVFRALKKNEIVGITVDGGGGTKTTSLRFLGRRANFLRGSADLALRTGAEIVPAFITTEKGLKHRLIIHPPIKVEKGLNRDETVTGILQDFCRLLETYVLQYPDHYGYTLCLRRSRAALDAYPFFSDYSGGER